MCKLMRIYCFVFQEFWSNMKTDEEREEDLDDEVRISNS